MVYPPVSAKATGNSGPAATGEYLLSLGRLVPYKRVDLAIIAAELIGIRLVVAGDGPDRRRLERMAGPHTEFVGAVSEATAGSLLENCRAFVFCAEEDFGIAPVEANAHGRPVVAYKTAGVLDTMVDGVTAEFFEERTVDAVVAAIQRALRREWQADRLKENAARFAPEEFRAGIAREAALAVAGYRA